jgi:hypothetical protein
MSMTDRSAELSLPLPAPSEPDPELQALPEPRRPGRILTLLTMAVTGLAALGMIWALRREAVYALRSGPPEALDNIAHFTPRSELDNAWVRGEALLGSQGAIRYGRPLEGDSYRLAPVASNPKLWVQFRVPEGMEGPRFVPPTSFVGRLVPMQDAGLRHQGLKSAIESTSDIQVAPDARLLIDGEAPSTTRWALGLIILFVGFFVFNVYGVARLGRRVKDA